MSEALPHLLDAESCVMSALGVHPGVEHVPVGRAGLTGELEQENRVVSESYSAVHWGVFYFANKEL